MRGSSNSDAWSPAAAADDVGLVFALGLVSGPALAVTVTVDDTVGLFVTVTGADDVTTLGMASDEMYVRMLRISQYASAELLPSPRMLSANQSLVGVWHELE